MKKLFFISLILVPFILYSWVAFKSARHNQTSLSSKLILPDSLFHPGDIIFRDGRGFLSNAFKKFSLNDPKYSHAGIIAREDSLTYVYHIIGGEGESESIMRKELLRDFCSSKEAYSIAIYRTDLDGNAIIESTRKKYDSGIVFDSKFDLATDNKMYCTELVYKILIDVSGNINYLPLTSVRGKSYIACDNIHTSSRMQEIFTYKY